MSESDARAGFGYGVLAYGAWAVAPLYWKLLVHVPALELLAHRVVWAAILFGLLAWARGHRLREMIGSRRMLALFALSGTLLAINWGTFVYAVETERVLHASLGYFINPIVSVLLGSLILRERLRRLQWLAVGLALVGVAQMATSVDGLPWIALVLAGSFGSYGLARKMVRRGPLEGSTVEALFLLPVAIVYVGVCEAGGHGHFHGADAWKIMLSAPVTALPLLWFASAAKRLPLSSLGFMQYIAPTGQFLLAVALFGETFTATHARSFACIWAGVLVFCADIWLSHRGRAVSPKAA